MIKKSVISVLIISLFGLNIPLEACSAQKSNIPTPKIGMPKIQKKIFSEKQPKAEYSPVLIQDSAAEELKKMNLKKHTYKKVILEDEPVITEVIPAQKSKVRKRNIQPHHGEKIVLKPLTKIRTSCKKVKFHHRGKLEKYEITLPEIGDPVPFKVMNDVNKDGEILIKKGTIINAEVALVSPKALGGAPAEIVLENLTMTDSDGNTVSIPGKLHRQGYSLALWIGIVELATTPFIFGFAAPLMRFAPGGQAVLTPRKEYIINY